MILNLIEDQKVHQLDIGVISAYQKQTEKLRVLLRKKNLSNVKVSSVEEFQSQEKKVLFISTVRSSRRWNEYDRKFGLGFLANKRRLNTAITRAVALLVVVGDPYILCQVRNWTRGFYQDVLCGFSEAK